jgi:hypothetical protein
VAPREVPNLLLCRACAGIRVVVQLEREVGHDIVPAAWSTHCQHSCEARRKSTIYSQYIVLKAPSRSGTATVSASLDCSRLCARREAGGMWLGSRGTCLGQREFHHLREVKAALGHTYVERVVAPERPKPRLLAGLVRPSTFTPGLYC